MKKTRHTEEQIAFPLEQVETGTSVAEVIRRMGISEQTFYRWNRQAHVCVFAGQCGVALL